MTDLILHHYALSPFSRKIRVMLGHAGLRWQSAVTREYPPRPVLARLAGGYRRVPVGQIGADIFCDSKIIAEEIARLSGLDALALPNCPAAVQDHVREADLEIFLCCIMSARPLGLLRNGRSSLSPLDALGLLWDRVKVGRQSAVGLKDLKKPRERVLAHLAAVEGRLRRHDFLFGAAPNHADFSTYHALWFMRDMGASRLVDGFPATIAWMARMNGFGEGDRREIAPEDALSQARAATPRPIDPEHRTDPRLGASMIVSPADYARDAARGTLAGVTPSRWILAREEPGLGMLHIHFPCQGYDLRPG